MVILENFGTSDNSELFSRLWYRHRRKIENELPQPRVEDEMYEYQVR